MPVTQAEEMQRRQLVVTVLNANIESRWNDLHRLATCRRYGIGKRQTWDSIWATMWSRYFGSAQRLSIDDLRRVFDARKGALLLGDPCRSMFHADWAVPLGLSVDTVNVCQEFTAALEEICIDYQRWKMAALGC